MQRMDSVEDIITIISLHTMEANSALKWQSFFLLLTQMREHKGQTFSSHHAEHREVTLERGGGNAQSHLLQL